MFHQKSVGIKFYGQVVWSDNRIWLNHLVYTKIIEPPHDKTNKMTVRPAKIQISLGIRPVW